ncbi:hypothetical protein TNCV_4772891 [Trichonephila clavipes]|nr:hypothetical protein TNCV_4772891 [Trichonephila clavipes]
MKKRKCGTAPEVRRPGAPEGRGLIWLLHLQALAEQNGVAFTPLVALPGVDTLDVHRPLRPDGLVLLEVYGNKGEKATRKFSSFDSRHGDMDRDDPPYPI